MRAEEYEPDEASTLDESALEDEVHIHQERKTYIRQLCTERDQTYLGRSFSRQAAEQR